VKIALGTHTLTGYPRKWGGIPPPEARRNLFAWLRRRGFDGVEVGSWWLDVCTVPPVEVARVRDEMADHDLEMAGFNLLRKNVVHPSIADENRRHIRHAVEVAKAAKVEFVSISFSLAASAVGLPDDRVRGTRDSPGASKDATEEDFGRTAEFLSEIAREAATANVEIAVELHHCSLADNSRSLLHLLELTGEPNVSANPDLGNVHWGYAVPEEPWHEAIERLAGRVKVWHVKNVKRTHIPEIDRSFFSQAALDDGDIDYRWALGRLMAAGFDGYVGIEGAGPGDILAVAARGKAYLDELVADVRSGVGLLVQ
jgi:sugar phosphate isomerase/epimerase